MSRKSINIYEEAAKTFLQSADNLPEVIKEKLSLRELTSLFDAMVLPAIETATTLDRQSLENAKTWHPVDTAPRTENHCLLCNENHLINVGYFKDRMCYQTNGALIDPQPTHWMPLPKAPA